MLRIYAKNHHNSKQKQADSESAAHSVLRHVPHTATRIDISLSAGAGGGLLLVGKHDSRIDSSIHMLFVSFDLSVIWINAEMQVVDKTLAKSWRPAYFSKQPAKYVLEIHPERWGDFEIG